MTTTLHEIGTILVVLKAMADEKRLRILSLLAGGERCVCELQDELEAGQSLLSHHLKALKDAGLVSDRRDGRWVYYSLNRKVIREVEDFMRKARTAQKTVRLSAVRCD
jgi:ArsR family transcriptional regulator